MLEKYDLKDLYLGTIDVMFSEDHGLSDNVGGMFISGTIGYGYITVLKKEEDKYIDLQFRKREITTQRDPNKTSYILGSVEPLSAYYKQDGTKRFTRRQALNTGNDYFCNIHQKELDRVKQR